ncbi:hypothetical protein [Pseudonocardia sp. WMMC193]|uniref:hypothetical protein n=1 Tax=Pseudonocardia sp. WMMC193 TaxID=2911965 RepID=UPI001F24995B|nr:hypothetical protein [Pseudonocardia sp. WMMC193]MCF7547685.1 hypothetical protein [Pseudonocardia sp. WMMC193]
MEPQQVADAVLAHPAVVRLDGGPFGTVASYLPGHRVVGVRLGVAPEPVEVAVVLRWPSAAPLTEVAAQIVDVVRAVVGEREVEVTVADTERDTGRG